MPFKMNNDKHLSGYISSRERSYCPHFPIFILAGGSEVKAFASNVEDPGSIPGSGRSPGEGNGNPLQYEWSSSFPYFLQFKSEFGNKEFMI